MKIFIQNTSKKWKYFVGFVAIELVLLALLSLAFLGQNNLSHARLDVIDDFALKTQNPVVLSTDDMPPPNIISYPNIPNLQLDTTLAITIKSSPFTTLDNGAEPLDTPGVMVAHAIVTNTGNNPAIDVVIEIDYEDLQPDPAENWELVPGEDPIRTIDNLPPGESYHAYWFVTYPYNNLDYRDEPYNYSLIYTVRADAVNATEVLTSYNAYLPNPIFTLFQRPTNWSNKVKASGIDMTPTAGATFTLEIDYDLSSNPVAILLSPVGNENFDAAALRLVGNRVQFEDVNGNPQGPLFKNRTFFPIEEPLYGDHVKVEYIFKALDATNSVICPYVSVNYQTANPSYNGGDYCDESALNITVKRAFTVTKHASSGTIQQGDRLTYTIMYTNASSVPLQDIYIWDDIHNQVTLLTDTISPAPDPSESTLDRVVWHFDTIPVGGPYTLTFAVLVDGNGQGLINGHPLSNSFFWTTNPTNYPDNPTNIDDENTITTTVEAPDSTGFSKTVTGDIIPGQLLTYTLDIVNDGAVAMTNVVVTDVLPSEVTFISATPTEDSQNGQTVVWTFPSIAANSSQSIEVVVEVNSGVPNGIELVNIAEFAYQNSVDYPYGPFVISNTSTVDSPDLSIQKTAPAQVIAGSELEYTINYYNNSGTEATGVVITDVVPANTSYQSCSGGLSCQYITATNTVNWDVGTIPPNSNDNVSFKVLVTDTIATGDTIVNADYGFNSNQTPPIIGEESITTTVNNVAAIIMGYAFVDNDGDGIYNLGAGDGPLSPITITLIGANNPITVTQADGSYGFIYESENPISVSAALAPGYFRTTPGTVFLDAVLETTTTLDFGYAPNGSAFGVVYGTVFEDNNHDMQQNLNEKGLKDVEMTSSEADTSPINTNQFGQYTFRYSTAQDVTITETNPPFYVSTTPNPVTTAVATGSSNASPVDFGNFEGIKITGQIFDDVNVNGQNDGEPGVEGSIIIAGGDTYQTDATGTYTLYVSLTSGGSVTIIETDPNGYLSTNAIPGSGAIKINNNELQITTPISGTVYNLNSFADVLATAVITATGQVWDDSGVGGVANGIFDSNEGGLSGVEVSVSSGLQTVTDGNGYYSLLAPPGQVVTLTQTDPANYVSTNAIAGNNATKVDNNTLTISGLGGGSTTAGNLFGDVSDSLVAIITGNVFDDQNENGVRDGGEPPFANAMIGVTFDNGVAVWGTDANGNYSLFAPNDSTVRLEGIPPAPEFYHTTPPIITIYSPTVGTNYDASFGFSDDPDAAVIMGIVCGDDNLSGTCDFTELGLGDAVMHLDGANPYTTTATGLMAGMFRYTVSQDAIYNLSETNPIDYRSTTPDSINLDVTLGNSYWLGFGDVYTNTGGPYPDPVIIGVAFDDLNGNGQQDNNELGLAGVPISIDGTITHTTNMYGYATFATNVGSHIVTERDPALPNYRSTTLDRVALYLNQNTSVVVPFGDTLTDTFTTVMGAVFHDKNRNGVQDATELGLPNVLITLSNGLTTTTNAGGAYAFPVYETGFLQVRETDPISYHSTTPNRVNFFVDSLNETIVVNFGDNENLKPSGENYASIMGTVFDDKNGNGVQDTNELGLAGAEVLVNDGQSNTNEWGQFTVKVIVDEGITKTYIITEVDPAGYVSVDAIPGAGATRIDRNSLAITVTPADKDTTFSGNSFADVTETTFDFSKTAEDLNGPPTYIGDIIRYNLQVTNTGSYTAYNIEVVDDLPNGVTLDSVFAVFGTATGTDPVTWTIPTLPAGTTAYLFITVIVNLDQEGEIITNGGTMLGPIITNTIEVCPDGSPIPCDVIEAPSFNLSKTAQDLNGTPTMISDTILYTLQATNNSTDTTIANINITDDLPSGVTYVASSTDLGTLSGTDPVVWTLDTLPTETTATLFITVTINADQAGQTITNTATVSSPNPIALPPDPWPVCPDGSLMQLPPAEPCPTIYPPYTTLSANKQAQDLDGPPVYTGDTILYTLQVTNTGNWPAWDVLVTDDLPNGVTYVDSSADLGTVTGTDLMLWSIPELPTSTVATLLITVTINKDQAGEVITNTATVTSPNIVGPPPIIEPTCPNGTPEPCSVVKEKPDVRITKTSEDIDGAPTLVGDAILYTVQVTNISTDTVADVLVTDNLPNGVTLSSVSADFGVVTGTQLIQWTISNLPVDAVATMLITVTIDDDQAGNIIINTAFLTSTGTITGPPGVCTDGSYEPCEPVEGPVLNISKTAEDINGSLVTISDTIRYVLQITNSGSYTAFNVTVTDDLPNGVTYVDSTANLGTVADADADLIIWSIAELPSNAVATLVITVMINIEDDPYLITNTAFATATNVPEIVGPTPPVCVRGELAPCLPDKPILGQKTVEPSNTNVKLGDLVTYTIYITNVTPIWLSPVKITDTIPSSVDLQNVVVCNNEVSPPSKIYLPIIFKNSPTSVSTRYQANNSVNNSANKSTAIKEYIQHSLVITGNDFTWIGEISPGLTKLCATGTVAEIPWDPSNTAWIKWTDYVITATTPPLVDLAIGQSFEYNEEELVITFTVNISNLGTSLADGAMFEGDLTGFQKAITGQFPNFVCTPANPWNGTIIYDAPPDTGIHELSTYNYTLSNFPANSVTTCTIGVKVLRAGDIVSNISIMPASNIIDPDMTNNRNQLVPYWRILLPIVYK